MKNLLMLLVIIESYSCSSPADHNGLLQKRIDSLEQQLHEAYKPGFGEFMSSVQVHHAKLWFAGQQQNWKLADFEIHEMMEAIDNIKKYQTERKESKLVGMIDASLDSVNQAIQQQSLPRFIHSYQLLTNNCNNCHREVEFEFNRVKIPETPPFSNQDFSKP